LIGVNERGTKGLGGKSSGRLVLGQAETVVRASEHVQQCVADMLSELPMHGAAVIYFMAGNGLPDTVIRGRGSPTPGVDLPQWRAVGIFAIREPVIDPAGPLHHFRRRAGHGGSSIGGRGHLPEPVRVHTQPIEGGAYIHIGSQFSAGVVGIAGLMGKDYRVVDTLLST